ncbi:MAG: hypothetical protein ABI318_04110, partial [Chthoniobacteraceae bacterium]
PGEAQRMPGAAQRMPGAVLRMPDAVLRMPDGASGGTTGKVGRYAILNGEAMNPGNGGFGSRGALHTALLPFPVSCIPGFQIRTLPEVSTLRIRA